MAFGASERLRRLISMRRDLQSRPSTFPPGPRGRSGAECIENPLRGLPIRSAGAVGSEVIEDLPTSSRRW